MFTTKILSVSILGAVAKNATKKLNVNQPKFLLNCRFQSTQPQQNESKYRYSMNITGKLTEEQQNFYEENGYLVVKGLVPHEDIDIYQQRFDEYAQGKAESSGYLILQKELAAAKKGTNEQTLYKIQELYADDVLFGYCKHPKVLDWVQEFIGPNIHAIHTMLINKPPDTGSKSSRHPLHQDLHYFPIRPADRIVAAWTAMEQITRENGCLVAIPGSHKGEHLDHDYPDWEGGVNKFYYGIKSADTEHLEKRVHLEMDKGDCVFFHPILIHGSGINRTKGFRKAISCHYAAAECHYIDVKGTIQEKLANEIIDIYLKKMARYGNDAVEVRYEDLWQIRSRLVRGKSINL